MLESLHEGIARLNILPVSLVSQSQVIPRTSWSRQELGGLPEGSCGLLEISIIQSFLTFVEVVDPGF